ncbi:MAG: divalent-cation tolerance protein CutA [Caulobacterales bacterium]|nr:divalent-cation tolerance protein CutA [Caulobacterales bacterium]
MNKIALLYTTWPDAETAESVARAAVSARLCACVNVLPQGQSLYRWADGIEVTCETIAIFKTTAERTAELSAFIVAEHPYDVPAVVALDTSVLGSSIPFLNWVANEVTPSP